MGGGGEAWAGDLFFWLRRFHLTRYGVVLQLDSPSESNSRVPIRTDLNPTSPRTLMTD